MPFREIGSIDFLKVYPMYVQKTERKSRTQEEVDEIICWLTGYDKAGLKQKIAGGVVCIVRVENIEDPLIQDARYMDKLIDELAKGRRWRRYFES